MMKHALILPVSLAFGLTSAVAHANGPASPSLEATDGSYEVAGLTWRCGKNNPVAWWGAFGNGCLKQKRAAKRKGQASTGGNFRGRAAGAASAEAPPHHLVSALRQAFGRWPDWQTLHSSLYR